MSRKIYPIFFQIPNSPSQTLILDPEQIQTIQTLKLSLLGDWQNLSNFYFTLNGKPLDDSAQISSSEITHSCTLVLQSRVYGGGGDGGATGAESRDCYLNMYADRKPDKVDPNEQRLSKWLNCALSNEPLKQPCVIDGLGNVFNKEALVQGLLSKNLPKEFGYIKGLKDMIPIKLEEVCGDEPSIEKFQCPITGLEFNGKYNFFALRNCGHVLSAKALKVVKSPSCLVCYTKFEDSDKIVINGSKDEVTVLKERMEGEKLKVKEKCSKKVKRADVVINGEEGVCSFISQLTSKKHGFVSARGLERAACTAEENENIQKVEWASNRGIMKRFKAADMAPTNANKEVYASIFTSSKRSDFKETFACRSLPLGRN